jgi:imidazolonepropionase-like amidohydrolase
VSFDSILIASPPLETIQTTTINAADALDYKDAGVLETWRYADLIAVPGIPANDVTLLETSLSR